MTFHPGNRPPFFTRYFIVNWKLKKLPWQVEKSLMPPRLLLWFSFQKLFELFAWRGLISCTMSASLRSHQMLKKQIQFRALFSFFICCLHLIGRDSWIRHEVFFPILMKSFACIFKFLERMEKNLQNTWKKQVNIRFQSMRYMHLQTSNNITILR